MAGTIAPIFPQRSFTAVAAVLAITVLAVGGARLGGYRPPSSVPVGSADSTRLLQFEDAAQGVVIVRDAATRETIATFGRGEGSFVRATLRALVHDRQRKGASLDEEFRLESHGGNQLFLIDEATGKALSLNAFGPANTAAFAAFMSNQRKGEGQ